MLNERPIVLILRKKSEFLDKFTALEYVENIHQISDVRARNKTPIFVRDSSIKEKIGGCEEIHIPEDILGDVEKFTEFCYQNEFECGDYFAGILQDTSQERCFLCEIANYKGFDNLQMYNQFVDDSVDCIIYESENFLVVPEKGALKQGFVMIVPKKHYYSAAQFPRKIIAEYKEVCKDVEEILLKAFKGKKVVFMEHGSSSNMATCKKSIVHAHIHVVVDFCLKAKYKKNGSACAM